MRSKNEASLHAYSGVLHGGHAMTSDAALCDALATFRLTRLVVDDKMAAPARKIVHDHYGYESGVGYLIGCYWCSGFWAGLFVATARTLAPRLWDPVAKALAFSAVTGLIAGHA